MKITIGHTHDADDAFMFYAMLNGKIDTGSLTFSDEIVPISQLNSMALDQYFDMTAISVASYPQVARHYEILESGACMAEKRGPVLVVNRDKPLRHIAVPGFSTSAFVAARLHTPEASFIEYPYDQILAAVQNGNFDGGVLITEDQLRVDHSLFQSIDLGKWWLDTFALPLPLGVDVVRRRLPLEVRDRIQQIFRESITYAIDHPDEAMSVAQEYARGMEPEQALRFVRTFVNGYTVGLGARGRRAIDFFLKQLNLAKCA